MNLQEDKKKISEAFFGGMNSATIQLYGIIKENLELLRPIYPLIKFINDRLVIVTDLANRGSYWDAEIICRSALEALIKFTFIVSAEDKVEREQRLKEYWQDLREINSIKSSEQAKKNLALAGDVDMFRIAFSPILLSDDEERELRLKWSRADRKKLEQKWSFSEITVCLAKKYLGKGYETLGILSHSYRLASHVTHADETGLLVMAEREQRTESEKEIAEFAHYFRLLSDSLHFSIFMGIQLSILTNQETTFFTNLQKSLEQIHQIGDLYQQELQKSETYDKYRQC